MDDILFEAESKMDEAIVNMEKRMTNIRAGRANPAMLDGVMVSYYGVDTPLKQLATISIPEARQLAIKPFDKSSIGAIEKGIFDLYFKFKGEIKQVIGTGNGPLDACLNGLKQLGFDKAKLSYYKQYSIDSDIAGSSASAMSAIFMHDDKNREVIGRAIDTSTALANVKAIFNALNQLY